MVQDLQCIVKHGEETELLCYVKKKILDNADRRPPHIDCGNISVALGKQLIKVGASVARA